MLLRRFSSELKVFRFKKTDLDVSACVLPESQNLGGYGRYSMHPITLSFRRSVVEFFVLWQLGQSAASDTFGQ